MSSEPVVASALLLAAFQGKVFALGSSGERVWMVKVADPSSGPSPVRLAVQGERVFALALRSLACLEYASGRVLWQVEVESAVSGSLLVDGGRVLVAGAGKVAAYDAMDGRELWQQPFKGEGFGPVSLAVRGVTVQADVGGY